MSGPRERNLSMWQYHLRRLAELPPAERPEDHVTDDRTLRAWQTSFRDRLRDHLGPTPARVDPQVDVEPRPDPRDEGFTRHRLVAATERHLDVPAWLLVPQGHAAPGPAVLAIHGHGPEPWTYDHGRDAVAGPAPADGRAADALAAQCPPFAAGLAAAGFVVLAPDLRGFGERWDGWTDGHRLCDLELAQATARGDLPLAGNLWDLGVCLDVLTARDEVDAGRIGVAGFSYGGTLALFLAALDPRVRAAVVSGAFADPRVAARVPFNVCGAQVLPGLLADVDHVQLGAAVAPRALYVEAGDEDFLWPADALVASAERVAALYGSVAAAPAFEAHVARGPHRWSGVRAEGFLRDWL